MANSTTRQVLLDAFDKHVNAELDKDLETVFSTLTSNPHINNIPTLIGGNGLEGVKQFYTSLLTADKFFPPDVEMIPISRTVDDERLVDEIVFKFTHTTEINWMLPNIPPSGKVVEIPLVVIVGFKQGKIKYEHIYWDQASVLVQIGLLTPEGLPVAGVETAKKLLELAGKQT